LIFKIQIGGGLKMIEIGTVLTQEVPRASAMRTQHTSPVMGSGGPFHEALEVLVLSLEN